MRIFRRLALCSSLLFGILMLSGWIGESSLVKGAVKLPAVFCDHMVLQQNQIVPVWGWAEPGEKVTISLNGKEATTTTGHDGKWQIEIAVPKATGKPLEMIVSGKNRIVLKDVLAGEVWLCSGQSNMQARLQGCQNGKTAAAKADYPQLRLFQVKMWASSSPMADVNGGAWQVCTPETAARFSGVAFYFGRDLLQNLDIPIGLIDSSSGGTAVEAWVSNNYLASDPLLKNIIKLDPEFYQSMDTYEKESAEYQQARKEKLNPLPAAPKTPFRGWGYPSSAFYNAMIAPLIPYPIRGVVWYQGEARTGRPAQYQAELTALLKDWRARWDDLKLKFLVVQLPGISAEKELHWPITREAQQQVAQTHANVGMIVTYDLGDGDLHPRHKEPFGQRLAKLAIRQAFGSDVIASGPVYAGLIIDNNTIRVNFLPVANPLPSPMVTII